MIHSGTAGGLSNRPLHVKAGIPNQDSWRARRYKWGNVVVVSDGLGSKAHSDHGSKAACLAVFEAARNYQNTLRLLSVMFSDSFMPTGL